MKHKTSILTLTVLFMLGCTSISTTQPTVTIANHTFYVDLAKSAFEKNTGLSNRYTLAQDWGMLFVYEEEQQVRYWMKDMRFPLDIMWLDENRTITHLVENAPACKTACQIYDANATYILEVNAGIIQALNVSTGDMVMFHFVEN
ncbi:hypothetical protein COT72_04950 [archaeon CG10_big_fil_rev_8_21_14_0_10_43_11]|nr:MAG: hypothetical protein COT72_04950 [archaeon CG10_big_fil_rev_8_21_14_0_10_43_11]